MPLERVRRDATFFFFLGAERRQFVSEILISCKLRNYFFNLHLFLHYLSSTSKRLVGIRKYVRASYKLRLEHHLSTTVGWLVFASDVSNV